MKKNNSTYHVKIIAEKGCEKPGGNYFPGYCICTADLSGYSNHVLSLLFCVEAAVCNVATKLSSTNVLSKWNITTGVKSRFFQMPVHELTLNKFHYREDSSSIATTKSLKL